MFSRQLIAFMWEEWKKKARVDEGEEGRGFLKSKHSGSNKKLRPYTVTTMPQSCLSLFWLQEDCYWGEVAQNSRQVPMVTRVASPANFSWFPQRTAEQQLICLFGWAQLLQNLISPVRCVFLLLLLLHFLLLLWLMLGPPTITSMLPCSAKSHIGLAKACYTCGRGLAWPEEHGKKEKRKK